MGFIRGVVGGFLGATLANGNVLLFASGVLVGVWADQTYGLPDVASELNRSAQRSFVVALFPLLVLL